MVMSNSCSPYFSPMIHFCQKEMICVYDLELLLCYPQYQKKYFVKLTDLFNGYYSTIIQFNKPVTLIGNTLETFNHCGTIFPLVVFEYFVYIEDDFLLTFPRLLLGWLINLHLLLLLSCICSLLF